MPFAWSRVQFVGDPIALLLRQTFHAGAPRQVLPEIVQGMLEGAGQQLPLQINGKEARTGVYVFVASHEISYKRDAPMTLDIPFGSRQDARMNRVLLQLRWTSQVGSGTEVALFLAHHSQADTPCDAHQ